MMRCANYDRPARLAYLCILHSGQAALPIDPLAMLRQCRDTQVMTYAEAAEKQPFPPDIFERMCEQADALTFGYTLSDGTQRHVVCYRPGGNAARLNFTLAHELGHLVLGHQSSSPAEEAEANHFAAHLLCPRPVIRRLMAQYEPLYAEQIARVCFTSIAASQTILRSRPCWIDPALEQAIDHLLTPALSDTITAPTPTIYWHPVHPSPYVTNVMVR